MDGSGSINFGGNMLTSGQVASQITAHAVTGGVISKVSGGKFGHGFFSAGVTKGLGGAYLPGGSDLSGGDIAYGTVVSAVIGGTASVISGGKFENGAKTGAMQYLFNQVSLTSASKVKKILNSLQDELYGDMMSIKKIMENSMVSDDIIDFLEDKEYIKFGEWDGYRDLDLTNTRSNRILSFRLRIDNSYNNIRNNYIQTTLQRAGKDIGDVMINQYDIIPHVKSAVISLSPDKLEQYLLKFGNDINGAIKAQQ